MQTHFELTYSPLEQQQNRIVFIIAFMMFKYPSFCLRTFCCNNFFCCIRNFVRNDRGVFFGSCSLFSVEMHRNVNEVFISSVICYLF